MTEELSNLNKENNKDNQTTTVQETKIEEKKEKIVKEEKIIKKSLSFEGFFKKNWFYILVIVLLLVIIVLTAYTRTTNIKDLKDITTGNYTLGPDLDPFLYLRHAEEIVQGKLKDPDMLREAPLGTVNYAKTNLMPWAIVGIYRVLSIFTKQPEASVEFAAVIAPVIFVILTLIVFFFFVMKLFSSVTKKKNSIVIALIATAFYAFAPEMLHRTTGGIPELESLGMLWFWSAFLFFVLAWQQDKIKKIVPFALLSGVFTGLMNFSWGGFRYIFMSFGLAGFFFFLFEKQKKKNFLVFTLWLVPSLIFSSFRIGLMPTLRSLSDTGFATAIFIVLLIDMLIFNTKLKKIKEKIKLPDSIITLIIVILIGVIVLIILKPTYIVGVFSDIFNRLLYPFGRGRIGLTVAENRAPYFVEVFGSFSWLFWTFFFGTLAMFYEATKHFEKKKKLWLNIFFIFFLITFIFSRVSPTFNLLGMSFLNLNGQSFFSRFLYFGGLALLIIAIFYNYISAYLKKDEKSLEDFREINFSYILILAFIFWTVVSMRGAVRLFFIISPAIIMASAFLPVKVFEYFTDTKDTLKKILLACVIVLITLLLVITFINNEKSSSQQARWTVLSSYYQQWQKAMAWVRENTTEDSIFVHWWDYGYWVQTWGKRATVTDGGHPNSFWDHTTARYLMTAQSEKTALQLCKAYNVSYFLIDSTDVGKYSAFASIGSDKTGEDRLSWVSTFTLDEKQTQEKNNETTYVYVGGTAFDQDIVWKGQLFPMQKAGVGALLLTLDKKTGTITRLEAYVGYGDKGPFTIPMRYIWVNNKKYDLKKGDEEMLNSMMYIVPSVTNNGFNTLGGALYLSEKALNTQWVRLYLLNETQNFELVHTEPSFFVQQLKDVYNISAGDFVIANDFQGPIKIWKVNYPENITFYPEYLKQTSPDGHWAELDYLGV